MIRKLGLVSVPFLAVALMALAMSGSASGRAAKTVAVDDDFFTPTTLKIKQNDTVKFDWVSDSDHTVTSSNDSPQQFDSGVQGDADYVYKRKFKKAGKYEILCTLHEEMRMDLKVKRKRR